MRVLVCGRATSGGAHSNSWCCVFRCCCCVSFFYWFLSLVTGGKHNNWICARILHCCSCFRCRCLCCCCIAAGVGVEKRAHNTHTQRPQSNPHAETIYKYICITQKFMCACAFVCVCFVGPQLLLAFIFSQLSQSCLSRQLENTHRNKKIK